MFRASPAFDFHGPAKDEFPGLFGMFDGPQAVPCVELPALACRVLLTSGLLEIWTDAALVFSRWQNVGTHTHTHTHWEELMRPGGIVLKQLSTIFHQRHRRLEGAVME